VKEQAKSEVGPSVLLIENDPTLGNVTRDILSHDGLNVYAYSSGEDALKSRDLPSVDLILCDVSLPNLSSFDFFSEVRKSPHLSYLPVVFISGFHDGVIEARARELGVDDFLLRPIQPEQFIQRVRSKIQRSRQIRRDQAEEIGSYRRRIITTLSHEFRTPLVSVITASELLTRDLRADDEECGRPKVRRLLEAVQRGGQRLERLVNDFMTMQQLEAGIMDKVFASKASWHAASGILETFEHSHRDWLKEAGYQFDVVLQGEDFSCFACDSQLLSILERLLSNAVKFSDKGKTVSVCAQVEADECCFEIVDQGQGIDMTQAETILAPFSQINRERNEQQGTGLGLAIASRLAQVNGGRLELQPAPGGGTAARVLLPMKHRAPAG
jgi:two-component system sensor histidine kinase/response regulator